MGSEEFRGIGKLFLKDEIEDEQHLAEKHQRKAAQQEQGASAAPGTMSACNAGRGARRSAPDLAGEAAMTAELGSQDAEELLQPIEDFLPGLPEQSESHEEAQDAEQTHHTQSQGPSLLGGPSAGSRTPGATVLRGWFSGASTQTLWFRPASAP